MYPILKAEKLADKIYLMVVEAPRVARACEPGEFVIVKMGEELSLIHILIILTRVKSQICLMKHLNNGVFKILKTIKYGYIKAGTLLVTRCV